MVDYPIVRFVADMGDTVARLDLNDGTFTTDHDGFSLGAPTLEVDPQAVGVPYGERTVTLTTAVEGDPAVVFPALSALSIELQRWRNWIMFQYDADSAPFWIRTLPSAPQPINMEDVRVGDGTSVWREPVELRAEPFVRGAEVTLTPEVIGNDPAAGVGSPTAWVLPAIEGDAPAPLNILVDSTDADVKAPAVCVSAIDGPFTPPLLSSDWFFPLVSKTTNAAYVSGGYYAVDVDGTLTVTPPFAGRYKAFLRAGFSDTSTNFDLNLENAGRVRITARAIGNPSSEPWLWWGTSGTQGWIDMGTVTLGAGYNATLNPSLETALDLSVRAFDGTGKIRIDAVLFVPVDDEDGKVEGRTVKTDPMLYPAGSRKFLLDGDRREFWAAFDAGSGLVSWIVPGLKGLFPQVIPGRTNVLHLLRNVNTGDDQKADDTTVTLSYYPRQLHPLGLA